MKKIFFFIHIPKTTGTSFRFALEKVKSVNMLCDYGKDDPNSTPELIAIDAQRLTPKNKIFEARKHNFLFGHVPFSVYAQCACTDRIVSIVRNPVERVVSEYQHLRRLYGFSASFRDFYMRSNEKNKQSQYLQGIDLGQGGLIGLSCHYKYFVELFSKKYNLPIDVITANTAPSSDTEERLTLAADEIKSVYKNNEEDLNLFFELAYSFAESVQEIGYNSVPPQDIKWQIRVSERKQLVGWVASRHKDCYFMEIKVNGARRAIASLNQCREDVSVQGLSENPECGFRYPLSLLGVEPGDVISVDFLGTPDMVRTIRFD